jgi:hypothetical protein
MIICFKCSPETRRALDSLLQSGEYKDYSEVISFAIMNMAVLHDEVLKRGSVIINSNSELTSPTHNIPVTMKEAAETTSQRELYRNPNPPTELFVVPAVFSLEGLSESPPPLADLPDDIWARGQEIPLDRWIFGQHNKLLPAKASCRALANLLIDKPKGVLLEEAAQQIAAEAAILGDFLAYQDKENGITRDEALSTAFPSTGNDGEKSRLRYANQFVASVNRQGQVSGLLMDLKLVNGRGRRRPYLMLTEIGWQFAVMPNPVLDDSQKMPTQKFSQNEREFLISHIAQSVPVEDFAYRTILTTIKGGTNTPETIDTTLQEHVPQDTERSLSKSFLSSQRSGAISRMADLGLVERVRDGVRVFYVVTDTGDEYLQKAR